MGMMIETSDKTIHAVFSEDDLFWLIGEYMGQEMKDAVMELFEEQRTDTEGYESYISDLKKRREELLKELDENASRLAELVSAQKADVRAISEAAGNIRGTIWEEKRRWI